MAQRTLRQVTRTDEFQVLWYGWRPVADTEGDPSDVQWTTTLVAPADYKAWEMYESAYGTTRGAGSGRWAVCPKCAQEFPIGEMTLVGGRYSDSKNGCAEEAQSDA